jgi:hypothetical protein
MKATKMREGLDCLLELHPEAEVARVLRQHEDDDWDHPTREGWAWPRGPWTEVDLILEVPSDRPPDLTKFAIWNRTGNVYKIDKLGAVQDDPFIEVTPMSGAHHE